MIIKNLEVTEVVLKKVDSKYNKVALEVQFSNDSPLLLEFYLEGDYEQIINKIIKQIKLLKKPRNDDEGEFLSGISIVNVLNEEELKEKLPKRLYMLDRKLDTAKSTKNYKEYMNLYSQLSTLEETIFQKN